MFGMRNAKAPAIRGLIRAHPSNTSRAKLSPDARRLLRDAFRRGALHLLLRFHKTLCSEYDPRTKPWAAAAM